MKSMEWARVEKLGNKIWHDIKNLLLLWCVLSEWNTSDHRLEVLGLFWIKLSIRPARFLLAKRLRILSQLYQEEMLNEEIKRLSETLSPRMPQFFNAEQKMLSSFLRDSKKVVLFAATIAIAAGGPPQP